MAFDISEVLEKLKAIEEFAAKVTETKKLADQLAENFAKMKMSINQTINETFTEVAAQIDTLRKNMEQMESVKASTAPSSASVKTGPEPAPEVEPEPAPKTEPEPAPKVEAESVTAEVTEEGSDQLDFLLQQKDRLKAALTDLRFDYMRGYIPEEEYKGKEAELDSQLEDLDKQITALK